MPGEPVSNRIDGIAEQIVRPRGAERISIDEIAEAHRRIEEGGLEGKFVLCPDLPSRRERVSPQTHCRATSQSETMSGIATQ